MYIKDYISIVSTWKAFNTEAIASYKSCGMTDRIRRMEYRLED